MKQYLILAAIPVILSSCLKQSIVDAMLDRPGKEKQVTATMNYEINGEPVAIVVEDADRQFPGNRRLSCVKSNDYVLSGISTTDIVFTFHTDSLKVGNYKYTSNYGPRYVTTFHGYPDYVVSPGDNMDFNITSYSDGRISGNFSGQITPAIRQGYPDNVYGAPGSVLIKNGTFTNVPVFY